MQCLNIEKFVTAELSRVASAMKMGWKKFFLLSNSVHYLHRATYVLEVCQSNVVNRRKETVVPMYVHYINQEPGL